MSDKWRSLQQIAADNQSPQTQSELQIVNSYIGFEQWKPHQTLKGTLLQLLERAESLKSNLMKKHNLDNTQLIKQFKCKQCGRIFSTHTGLGGHRSKAHKAVANNPDQEPESGKISFKNFVESDLFKQYQQQQTTKTAAQQYFF